MSSLRSVISVACAASALIILGQSVATASEPPSSTGATHVAGPPKVCIRKPTKPNYPAERGSPVCCEKPKYWQTFYSGGILGQPKRSVWACALAPVNPK